MASGAVDLGEKPSLEIIAFLDGLEGTGWVKNPFSLPVHTMYEAKHFKRAAPKHSEKTFPLRTTYISYNDQWSRLEDRVDVTKFESIPEKAGPLPIAVPKVITFFSKPGSGVTPASTKEI